MKTLKEIKDQHSAFTLVNDIPEDLVESRISYQELKEILISLVITIENLED